MTSPTAFLLKLIVASAALGLASTAPAQGSTRAELESLSRRRVFFGHQSVGMNVIDGLRALAAKEGVALRIVDRGQGAVPAGTFRHAYVGQNFQPLTKLAAFAGEFEGGAAAGAEIALVKFCFVDVNASTDVGALFREYQRTIARARSRSPATVFVHVTVPLAAIPEGVKAGLKQVLGRPSGELLDNVRRDEYNALVRAAYLGKEPLFDLARVESTRPDGSAEGATWKGRLVPSLVREFTDDGGHLDADGQERAARELVSVLAAAKGTAAAGAR